MLVKQRAESHVASLRLGHAQIVLLIILSALLLLTISSEERELRKQLSQDVANAVTSAADNFMLKFQAPPPNKTLQIAWLMSFPNSGTSYTTKLIRHVSQTHTASNYGNENRGATGESVPLFADQPTGPFWCDPLVHPEYTNPEKYALTKTHCGTRCIQCGPIKYVETTFSFRRQCLSGKRATTVNGTEVMDFVQYPSRRVAKAVHLIRDPFSNVVSRFHLELHEGKSAVNYTKDVHGFRQFCSELNAEFEQEERYVLFLEDPLLDLLVDVPCRGDFIRWIEWHNLAFSTTLDMEIETFVLHYDWYANRFDQTVKELLEFLELGAVADPHPFIMGKVYDDYFTPEERGAVELAVHAMASKTSWTHVSRYFYDEYAELRGPPA